MGIEGPLRDLAVHDVFQLLDLGRKSGALVIGSELRNNEGRVWFEDGCVVYACIRSNPHPLGSLLVRTGRITDGDHALARAMQRERGDRRRLGEILVDIGAISRHELEQQVRQQVEAVAFELLSWDEGFFRFDESGGDLSSADATVRIPTESLLMEAARRIDEWSRIRERVPHLDLVPRLSGPDGGAMPRLDLLPTEWRMLTLIDGQRSLRGIAEEIGESEFDVARIAFGLVCTGVLELVTEHDADMHAGLSAVSVTHVRQARAALDLGAFDDAIAEARLALAVEPQATDARRVLIDALRRTGQREAWAEELRRSVLMPAQHAEIWREAGFLAAMEGRLVEAMRGWQLYLAAGPDDAEAERVRAALAAAETLHQIVEARFRA